MDKSKKIKTKYEGLFKKANAEIKLVKEIRHKA